MFCPQAMDFGNLADWVSGIGTILAVCTALGIALFDHRRLRNEKRAETQKAERIAETYNLFLIDLYERLQCQ